MDNNTAQVKLEASFDTLKTGLGQAKAFVKDVFSGMKAELKDMSDAAKADTKNYESSIEQMGNIVQNRFKGINGAIAGVKAAWAQMAVVVGAGLAMKAAVDETVQFNTEAQKLARTLNITTNQASILNMAIGDVYGTTDDYIAAAKGLDRSLKKNEEAMNEMGLVTRDANGEFRNQQDLVLDAMTVLRGYKEGTDRNIAATTLFGKGVDVSNEMLALNAEKLSDAKEKAESLNLVVGAQSVEATNNYRAALNDAQDALMGMKVAVGNALMPVLTDLANWFADIGPTAVLAIRVALATVTAIIRGLVLVVKVLWELFSAAFKNMADVAGAFGEVFTKLMAGDFAGAQAAAKNMFSSIVGNAQEAFANIVDAAYDAGSKTSEAFGNLINGTQQGETAAASGGKGYEDSEADKEAAKEAKRLAKEAAAEAKAAAAEQKRIKGEEYAALMEQLKGEEQAQRGHWEAIKAIQQEELEATVKMYGEKSKQADAIRNKIAATERAALAEHQRIEDLKADATRAAALDAIDAEEEASQVSLALHEITYEEMLAKAAEFEERRYQIKLAAMQEEARMLADEPVRQQQVNNEIEEMERQHQATLLRIKNEGVLAQRGPLLEMGAQFRESAAENAAAVLTGQMKANEGLKGIWKGMLANFTQVLAQKLAATKLFASLEIAVEKMVQGVLRVLHLGGVAQSIAAKGSESTAKIGASAAAAGAGAAESQASIPFIGPVLAIAAMAAIFAAVMGMKGKSGGGGATPSAAGGFDIPAGVNPLTQLHEKEMVLPAAQADMIRNLAEGGVAFGGGDQYHINALDALSFDGFLRRNQGVLARGIKRGVRDGNNF